MLTFDHFAISCVDLDAAAQDLEARLGCPLSDVGHHETFGTHNRLLGLGPGEYLELIAIDPAAAPPGRPRWFALDRFEGAPRITNWIASVPAMADALATMGEGFGEAVSLQRGPYRWQMAVPSDGELPFEGAAPALIEWRGQAHPATALPDRGFRLIELRVTHPDAQALAASLRAHLPDPRITFDEGPLSISARLAGPQGEVVL